MNNSTDTQADAENTPSHAPARKKKSIFSYLKWIPITMLLLVTCLALFVIMRFRNDAKIPYSVSTEGITIPTYNEIELPFAHNYV